MGRRDSGPAERWFFYQDAANLWKWARLDSFGIVLAYSSDAYPARADCVADARRCGYRDEPAPVEDFGTVGERASPSPYANTQRF